MAVANRVKEYCGKLRDTVERLNKAATSIPDTTVEAGDFQVNVTDRKVHLRGKDLQLTSAEFDLLLFLINHPRRIVSPQTRLATCWSPTAVRQADFLATLASLRKRLEAVDASHCYIRTEPWVFYRFYPSSTHDWVNEQLEHAGVRSK